MSNSGVSRHASYNNRFRTSSSGGDNDTTTHPGLHSVSENVDLFGHSPLFAQLSPQGPDGQGERAEQGGHALQRVTCCEQPRSGSGELSSSGHWTGAGVAPSSLGDTSPRQDVGEVPRPMAPGRPRRLSRQISADAKRQDYAASHNVTSVDSGCDDVFVDVGREPDVVHSSYILNNSSKRTVEATFSTSSTASILPNPYNRINHSIHSVIWCCSCLYFVFFCCLPAIYFMEQSDVEFNKNNQKRARSLSRMSSFLFFTGTLVTLSVFALIFFLAIFFSVY